MKGNGRKRFSAVMAMILLLSMMLPVTALADNTVVVEQGGTGTGNSTESKMLDWMKKKQGGGALDKITQVIEELGSSIYGLLQTVIGVLSIVMFFWAIIQIMLGGKGREQGKSTIFYIAICVIGAAGASWFVSQLINIGSTLK